MAEKKKILIIEDEEPVLDVYKTELEYWGLEVVVARDGDSGYEQVLAEKPDAILLDLMLPGTSGLKLLKKLKEADNTKDIKVIVLTNLDASVVVEEGYELGADAFLVKSQVVPSQVSEEIFSILGIDQGSIRRVQKKVEGNE